MKPTSLFAFLPAFVALTTAIPVATPEQGLSVAKRGQDLDNLVIIIEVDGEGDLASKVKRSEITDGLAKREEDIDNLIIIVFDKETGEATKVKRSETTEGLAKREEDIDNLIIIVFDKETGKATEVKRDEDIGNLVITVHSAEVEKREIISPYQVSSHRFETCQSIFRMT